MVRLLDDLGIDKTHLLGYSLGSMTALQLALDFPDRVERLVLYGSACAAELPGRFETFDQTMDRLASESIEATSDRIVPTWFALQADAPLYALCRAAGEGVRTETALAVLQALSRTSAWLIVPR